MLLNGILEHVNYQDGKRTRMRAEERLIETVRVDDNGRQHIRRFQSNYQFLEDFE